MTTWVIIAAVYACPDCEAAVPCQMGNHWQCPNCGEWWDQDELEYLGEADDDEVPA